MTTAKRKKARQYAKDARPVSLAEKPRWSAKLAEIRTFTAAKRGRVGELAAFLGVARPQASAWLSGSIEPGAEAALAMLEWLRVAPQIEAEQRAALASAAPPRLAAAILRAP